MGRWRTAVLLTALIAMGLLYGCELGWDFLKDGGGGGDAGAQTGCQNSRLVTGQFPPSGGLLTGGTFTANYSSPNFTGSTPTKPLFALRVSRNRLWLNDLSIEVSFFPFDDTARDIRNGCLGRALLEINIPDEDLFFDNTAIDIRSTRVSQTEPSAFYAEGGDPGFTSTAVNGTLRLRSVDGSRAEISFDLTFNPDATPRTFTNGQIDDDIDQNPSAEGLQPS
ncbi:MAG TPA: hypothetical protein VLK82_04190 [Candidatus Tectomicrobia bacterium]|nr:hypothetical protein [Candidatus Tectomicrobia bacterium]